MRFTERHDIVRASLVLSLIPLLAAGDGCAGAPPMDSDTAGAGGYGDTSSMSSTSSTSSTGGTGSTGSTSSTSGTGGMGGGSTGGMGGTGGAPGGCAGGAGGGSMSYDAAGDFSALQNPAGPWSYGWSTSMGAPFQLYAAVKMVTPNNLPFWWGLTDPPSFGFNNNPFPVTYLSWTMPPWSLNLHPGPNNEYSIVRWTAPATDDYHIVATFSALDCCSTTTNVVVLHAGSTELYAGNVTLGNSAAFTGDVMVRCGETIDFAVGFGSNGTYYYDSTRLEATITPL